MQAVESTLRTAKRALIHDPLVHRLSDIAKDGPDKDVLKATTRYH